MAALSTLAKVSGGGHVGDVFTVAVASIKIIPGFNYRDLNTPDARAKIRAMADDMLDPDIGYNQNKPMTIRMNGDDANLIDGHRRLEAVLIANAEGAGIKFIPCMSEARGTTDLERDYELFSTGEPLTIQEKAVGVKRQLNRSQSFPDIAKRLKVTVQTVKSWLDLNAAPDDVLSVVNSGALSGTEALKIVRRHGGEAGPVIERVIAHAKTRGKSRATSQDVKAVTKPRTEAVSLCTLALAVVTEYRKNGSEALSFEMAMEALEKHFGPLMEKAA